jgi:TRAP-type C4-dicarboxylate transport system permease small subunit
MDAILQKIYRGCAHVAAACVFLIAAGVVLEIILRLFGHSLPGVIEIATFALVGASFLALAHTFRHNVHIRITMITSRISPGPRRYFEIWSLAVSAAISAWFTFYCIGLAWDAYEFGDKSDGLLSIPLWIPQAMMAFGIGLLVLSLIEELINVLRGRKPIYQLRAEAAHSQDDEDKTGAGADLDRKD